MGRGLLAGTFWGLVVGAIIIMMASQLAERKALSFPQPEAEPVGVPGGTEFDQARRETEPVAPSTVPPPTAERQVAAPAVPRDDRATPAIDTQPVGTPKTTEAAPSGINAPDTASTAPAPSASNEPGPGSGLAPVVNAPSNDPLPEEPRPAARAPDRSRSLETPGNAPAAPTSPSDPGVARQSSSLADGVTVPLALPAREPTLPDPGATQDTPARPTIESGVQAPAVESAGGSSPVAPTGAVLRAPPTISASTPNVSAPEAPDSLPLEIAALPDRDLAQPQQPMPSTPAAESEASEPVATPAPAGAPVQDTVIEAPSPNATNQASLPRIFRPESSGLPGRVQPGTTQQEGSEAEAGDAPVDPRAIVANAIDYVTPQDVPLVAIVLVHDGGLPLRAEQINALPEQIAFAVDAKLPSARTIAQAYRDAGREVVVIPDMEAPSQPEAVVDAFARVPNAVAIMDRADIAFSSDRNSASSLLATLSASGHGLITYPRGLNSLQRSAEREGVPTRTVFRAIDSRSQSDDAIRRLLDQATFRARQDRSVILTVSADIESLGAVVEWALASRTGQIALAPVSAALLIE